MAEQYFSAQVILRSPPESEGQPATAETVRDLLPPSSSVQLAESYFRSRGFEVSPTFATSFSITGSATIFEGTFGRHVRPGPRGVVVDGTEGTGELPLDRLPSEVADVVQAVVFPPPPDFGPTAVRSM
jgi:hypothetical protein